MRLMRGVNGLHHITAIAGPAQENLDFYAGVLGMRLVKRSVNQDDPGTYHLFYADAEGSPGSDLTFFPWSHAAPPRAGHGLAMEVGLEVPEGSLALLGRSAAALRHDSRTAGNALWRERPGLHRSARLERRARRGATGASVHAVGAKSGAGRAADPRAVRRAGLGARSGGDRAVSDVDARASSRWPPRTAGRDTDVPAAPGVIDVRDAPEARRGAWGVGAVHHLAWRVDDEEHQLDVRTRVEGAGAHPTTVIDRFWFKSVYFKEPGGVLFELATDGPGFAVDEEAAHLGERSCCRHGSRPSARPSKRRCRRSSFDRVPTQGMES